MTLPKTVRIFGVDYKVSFKKLNALTVGEVNTKKGKIYLSSSTKNEGIVAGTLLHEIQHAIADEIGVPLDENQVRALSSGWTQVMRDNPDLLGFVSCPELENDPNHNKEELETA